MLNHKLWRCLLLSLLVSLPAQLIAKETISQLDGPVELTTEQDHQRVMDLLQIKTLRRGADGDPDSAYAANYDESKANPYPHLPDPLRLKNGEKVLSEKVWWEARRAEIVEDFDREIYGRVPANMPKVDWQLVKTMTEQVNGVDVISQTLVGHVDNTDYPQISVNIDMTVSLPAASKQPVPVVVVYGSSAAFKERMRKRFTEEQLAKFRGPGPTAKEQVLAKGWAYAELIPTSVQADNGAGLTQGIIGLLNKGQPRDLDDWGVLRAWAWSVSAAVDYFETNNAIDASKVAMAGDQRIAIGFISSSGEAGAKLFRRNFGEQVGNIAGSGEYHWMAGNFLKYAGPLTVDDMPGDAHHLMALCAPRPVFISSGNVGDAWVDAKGMFLAAKGASPVYELLGKKGLNVAEFPALEVGVMTGDIAYRQHNAGHTPGPNWPVFLTFASRYFLSE